MAIMQFSRAEEIAYVNYERGLEKGMEQTRYETAVRLLEAGQPDEIILLATNYSSEELNQIRLGIKEKE